MTKMSKAQQIENQIKSIVGAEIARALPGMVKTEAEARAILAKLA